MIRKEYLVRFFSLSLGLALVTTLQFGGAGGCGGGSGSGGSAGGGAVATPTAGTTASGGGSASAVTRAITSALTTSVAGAGGGAGLVVKLKKTATSGNNNLDTSCTGSSCTCGDEDSTSAGDIVCDFADLPNSGDFTICDDGTNISGTFNFSGICTFNNAVFDECGQSVTINGDVSFTGNFSFDCAGTETGTISLSTATDCSGLTVTDGDGASHDVGMNISSSDSGDTGSVCVDGTTSDISTVETECSTNSCKDACMASCSSDGTAALKATASGDSCETTCETECSGDNIDCEAGCEDDCGDDDACLSTCFDSCNGTATCEFTTCSMDANGDGVEDDPDDFACQQFADANPDSGLTTDNVMCDAGCCVPIDETNDASSCDAGMEAGCESQWGPVISGDADAVGCRSNLCTVDCNSVGISSSDCVTTLTGYMGWSCDDSNQCSMGITLQAH